MGIIVPLWSPLFAATNASASSGSASFRFITYDMEPCAGARLRTSAWVSQTSPGLCNNPGGRLRSFGIAPLKQPTETMQDVPG